MSDNNDSDHVDVGQFELGTAITAGESVNEKSPGRKKALNKPTLMHHMLAGATSSLNRVQDAIMDVDEMIALYGDLLAKAQPLNSGRVVIVFSKSHRVMIDEKCFHDIVPIPMRMVLYVSGTWHLRRAPPFTKLEELRVGQGLQSDRLVVQVLRELDKLFAVRAKLMTFFTDFRVPVVPSTRSAVSQAEASLKRLPTLKARLRLNWKDDAAGCRKAIRDERKLRSLDKKEALAKKTSQK